MPGQVGSVQQELAKEAGSSGDACSSSPRRPGSGPWPDPWPLDLLPLLQHGPPSLPAGLCKQLLRMDACRLLPAHFPFPVLSLSQGSSGKLAERDIFHALVSSAGGCPFLHSLGFFSSWSLRSRREDVWATGAAHFPFNLMCS